MKTSTQIASMLTLLSLTIAGQAPAPAPAAQPQPQGKVPTFSTSTRLVTVDVTVKDKAGNAISFITTPWPKPAAAAPISTKLPVTCAVKSPKSATKLSVST